MNEMDPGGFYAPENLIECGGCGREFEFSEMWFGLCYDCENANEGDD